MTRHIKTWQDRLGNSAHIKSGGAVGEAMQAEIDELRAALAQPASAPAATEFVRVARAKLDSLLSEGYKISGYSIERNDTEGMTRGFVTAGGLVGWWTPRSAPAAVNGYVLVPVEPTYGMLAAARRAYEDAAASLGRYTTDHAAYRAMLAAAPTGEPG